MEEPEVELEERELRYGETEIQLSNYDIKYLKQLVNGKLSNERLKEAALEVIKEQMMPFLKDTDRLPNQANIEKEIKEAFSTHLYNYVEPE